MPIAPVRQHPLPQAGSYAPESPFDVYAASVVTALWRLPSKVTYIRDQLFLKPAREPGPRVQADILPGRGSDLVHGEPERVVIPVETGGSERKHVGRVL